MQDSAPVSTSMRYVAMTKDLQYRHFIVDDPSQLLADGIGSLIPYPDLDDSLFLSPKGVAVLGVPSTWSVLLRMKKDKRFFFIRDQFGEIKSIEEYHFSQVVTYNSLQEWRLAVEQFLEVDRQIRQIERGLRAIKNIDNALRIIGDQKERKIVKDLIKEFLDVTSVSLEHAANYLLRYYVEKYSRLFAKLEVHKKVFLTLAKGDFAS